MTGKAVIVVGSLHCDIVVEASRLPTLGETLPGRQWFPKFGGKGGNQAVAAASSGLSIETRMVGAVGGDDFATFLLDHLQASGLATDFIARRADSRTGMSVAISVDSGDYGAVIVSGVNLELSPDVLETEALWRNAGVLILQNEIPERINLAAARAARRHGLRVCLNAAPARPLDKDLTELIDILVINAIEAEAYCGLAVNDLGSAERAASALVRSYPSVVVTAGGSGLAVSSKDGVSFSLQAKKVDVVSTHGAGDVFVGVLCAMLVAGRDLRAACETANARAAEHVASPTA